MLVIVAHHYVVNSGLLNMINESESLGFNDIFLLLFGWGGKTAINCFVLITGYFMCTSRITLKKYIKLLGARYFYAITIFAIFLISGYSAFGVKGFLRVIFPFFSVKDGFTPCFLLFYLFISFLNKFIDVITEKEHLLLLTLCLGIYTFLPSFAKANVTFNYVTWFIVIYFIASYLRLYPKIWFANTRLWGILTIGCLGFSWGSVVGMEWLCRKWRFEASSYFFVSDSNKILAVVTAVCAFMFFKNIKIGQSKFINTVAASTFGVLMIHANSDTMRQWLWGDILRNTEFYSSSWLVLHAFLSVTGVYIICTVIDQLRIRFIETPVLKKIK